MAIRITGLTSGLDTDSIVQELVSAYATKKDDIVKKQTKLEWQMDAWKDMNSKIYGFYTSSLSNMRFSSSYSLKKAAISDSTVATVSASSTAVNGTQRLKVKQLATTAYLTGGVVSSTSGEEITSDSKLSEMGVKSGSTISVNDTEIELTADMKVSDLVSKLKEAGVTASFDSKNQRFFISASESGADGEFELIAKDMDGLSALQSMGLFAATDINGEATAEMAKYKELAEAAGQGSKAWEVYEAALAADTSNSDVARINAQDAIIELNGATFTSNTGNFSINGLSISALNKTGDEAVTITTSVDSQGIYDNIKNFISKYNELITAMDTAYNADSAKGYEPLTDDEKDSMTDTQVEDWEKKIKDALLRRDSTLGNISSSMKNIMQTSFTINGKSYSLASLGISTQGYFTADANERGCLHIDGDSEDSVSAGNTDKLMAAINEDPEAVAEFFQQLSKKLYSDLSNKMASSTISSALTLYNDKEMQSQLDDYEDQIEKWEDKLEYYEEYYYNKFSAMETALSKLESQTSALAGLLGTG